MTVTACQHRAKHSVDFLPAISETTTPDEFEQLWKKTNGTALVSGGCERGMHCMLLAAQAGNCQLIRHLYLRDKNLLNLGDQDGWVPLFHAVYDDKLRSVEALLNLGANPNLATIQAFFDDFHLKAIPQGSTSLWLAAQRVKSIALTKLLFKYQAIAAPALDKDGQLVLEKAKEELAIERAPFICGIDSEVKVFPITILQMIVEYL